MVKRSMPIYIFAMILTSVMLFVISSKADSYKEISIGNAPENVGDLITSKNGLNLI